MFMVFDSYPERDFGTSSLMGAQQQTLVNNAGFNDAFIVPTVAGGVPWDGREPG